MKSARFKSRRGLVLAAVSMLLAGPALSGQGHRPYDHAHGGGARPPATRWQDRHRHLAPYRPHHFEARHYTVVREYYWREWHAGRHPPGWGQRHRHHYDHWKYRHHGHFNHHGHFKPWRWGYPLHHTVVHYEIPAQVATHLGPPPYAHRYVQVAGDILLIAIGTALVVDALEDLIHWR